MNIFVTHSYFYQLDSKQWINKTPYPPLATITALAHLEANGFPAQFYDVALDPSSERCQNKISEAAPDVVVIYEDGFNYLTKMCLTNMRYACFDIIATAKSKGAKVIVSSSDSTDHWELYHEKGADIIIHGEGEHSLLEVMQKLRTTEGLNGIQGISTIIDGKATKHAPRTNERELDVFPQAKWEVIDLEAYKSIWNQGKFPFTLNISTTRGCPFKCNWCAKPIYGNRYNSRSPERVVAEMKMLQDHCGVKHFWITDDIFGLKPGWVTKFNDAVQAARLKMHYKIQSRADLLMQDQTIDELAQSGLEEVWIGAESGSQKILDAMDKGITLDQIKKSTELLQQKGVRVAYFLQFGYLGETKEDVQLTLDMVRNYHPDDIGISVSYPLPGTKFYETVKAQMGEKSNWEDSDDLDLMFEGTFSPDYYRALQRFVHHRFRLNQGWRKLLGKRPYVSWRYVVLIPYNWFKMTTLKSKLS
ncbi:MAG: B12-binding domain-containing radical SAM protein [bacterium]|nr:B12-binding domain-containing radical SAM protein [bacterium]